MLKLFRSICGMAVIAAGMATATRAEAVVQVTLIGKAGTMDFSKSLNFGMGMHGDMKKALMGVNVNPKLVPRGAVKFNVTNLGSALLHEIILAEVDDENELLAYDIAKNMVDEETIQTLAQVAEIAPSKSASFTLELKPGKYLLYCNYAGHYMAGMWTVIEVK